MRDTQHTHTRYTTAESVILDRQRFFEELTMECTNVIESLYANAKNGIMRARDFEATTLSRLQVFKKRLSSWRSIVDERTARSLTTAEFYIELVCKNAVRKYLQVEKYSEMSLGQVLTHFSLQTKNRVGISRADLDKKPIHYNAFSISLVLNDAAAHKFLAKKTSGLYFQGTAVSMVRNNSDEEEQEHTYVHEDIHALLDGANLGNPSIVSDFVKGMRDGTALLNQPEQYLNRMQEEFLTGFIEAHSCHLFSDGDHRKKLERYLEATITAGADTREILETLTEMIASEKNQTQRERLEDYLNKFTRAFLEIADTLSVLSRKIHALPHNQRDAALLRTVVSLGLLAPSTYSTYLLKLPKYGEEALSQSADRNSILPQ